MAKGVTSVSPTRRSWEDYARRQLLVMAAYSDGKVRVTRDLLHERIAIHRGNMRVCGIVVTFRPAEGVVQRVSTLREQVEELVIVDNGSPPQLIELMEKEGRSSGYAVLRNGDNWGIGAALNRGIRWAKSKGCDWVALFDQDSKVTPNFISKMLSAFNDNPLRNEIALVAPRYKDPATSEYISPTFIAEDGAPLEVMTSGSMLPISTFQRCGLFREDFFIDQVDHEFSFRIRDYQLRVLQCVDATLVHAPGKPTCHSLCGLGSFTTSNHSAMRRYYMARNGVAMVRRYWRRYPKWSYVTMTSILFGIPWRIIAAESEPWSKVTSMGRGLVDGILGRMGKRSDA